jgi:hypothetical protein
MLRWTAALMVWRLTLPAGRAPTAHPGQMVWPSTLRVASPGTAVPPNATRTMDPWPGHRGPRNSCRRSRKGRRKQRRSWYKTLAPQSCRANRNEPGTLARPFIRSRPRANWATTIGGCLNRCRKFEFRVALYENVPCLGTSGTNAPRLWLAPRRSFVIIFRFSLVPFTSRSFHVCLLSVIYLW